MPLCISALYSSTIQHYDVRQCDTVRYIIQCNYSISTIVRYVYDMPTLTGIRILR